jgi:hypothetical protein
LAYSARRTGIPDHQGISGDGDEAVSAPASERGVGRVHPRTVFRVAAVVTVLSAMAALLVASSSAAPSAQGGSGRYLVPARSAADLAGLRAKAVAEGARVVRTIPRSTPWWSRSRRRPRAGWPPTGEPPAWPPTG